MHCKSFYQFLMEPKIIASLVRNYYMCGESATAAIRKYSYQDNKLKSPVCSEKYLRDCVKRFEETANANPQKPKGRTSDVVQNTETIDKVKTAKRAVEAKTTMQISSVRQIAAESGINRQSVHRILTKILNNRKFKISVMQELKETDYQARADFVKDFQENFLEQLEFVLWSDEAYFHVDGTVYTRNCFIWAEENPHKFITKPLHSEKVCVWVAFSQK